MSERVLEALRIRSQQRTPRTKNAHVHILWTATEYSSATFSSSTHHQRAPSSHHQASAPSTSTATACQHNVHMIRVQPRQRHVVVTRWCLVDLARNVHTRCVLCMCRVCIYIVHTDSCRVTYNCCIVLRSSSSRRCRPLQS